MVHELKSWTEFFTEIIAGHKTHDLRKLDRDFKIGDILCLREYSGELEEYSGRSCKCLITYITSINNPCALSEEGLNPEFCILSIKLLKPR